MEVFDVACPRIIEKLNIENLKAVQWKSLKTLVNMQDVFVI